MIWRASLVGARARSLFARPGYRGRVLAVVSDAVYLEGDDGEITWIAGEGLPAHTRGVLAAFEPRSLSAGAGFSVQGPNLRIGDDGAINLGDAAEWRPPALEPGQAAALAIVRGSSRQLLTAAQQLADGKGLGRIIPILAAIAQSSDAGLPAGNALQGADPLLVHASGHLSVIARACIKGDVASAARAGKALVGLGPGLTPAGDDFLGGLLFVARHLAATYPAALQWEQWPARELLAWARTRTNRISHAILGDMAEGHGPEPLHDLVISLLRGQDVNRLLPEAGRLTGIGHSSGWDILAGALTGTFLIEGDSQLRTAPAPQSSFPAAAARASSLNWICPSCSTATPAALASDSAPSASLSPATAAMAARPI